MGYEFSALRAGEDERVCVRCGRGYQPTSRTQKYCPACRKRQGRHDGAAHSTAKMQEKALRRNLEKRMNSNQFTLNDALFRELERIENCETRDEIETEGIRADKVCSLAANIVSNGRLMVQAAQLGFGVAESVNVPKALLGNGDGR